VYLVICYGGAIPCMWVIMCVVTVVGPQLPVCRHELFEPRFGGVIDTNHTLTHTLNVAF
jgi:hypothetical protein